MNILGQSVSDTLEQLLQSIQARFLFPSIIFVIANVLLFHAFSEELSFKAILVLLVVTVILSYTLRAMNGVLIKTAEGYKFPGAFFFRFAKSLELNHYRYTEQQKKKIFGYIKELMDFSKVIVPNPGEGDVGEEEKDLLSKIKILNDDLNLKIDSLNHYQSHRFSTNKFLSTSLGNTIAAFENYPSMRYNMDSVSLWPRMLHILDQKKYSSLIQSEKHTLDFLLNTCVLCMFFLLEILLYSESVGNDLIYIALIVGIALMVYLLYRASVAAAQDWGVMVCCAFDLFRFDLHKALKIEFIPKSLEEERAMWGEVSRFILYGKDGHSIAFTYSNPDPKSSENVNS